MTSRQKIFVLGTSLAVLIAAGASAMVLRPGEGDAASTAMTVSASFPDAPLEGGISPTQSPIDASPSAAPVIPQELRRHSPRIHELWADGANLSDHYVQFTLPCDGIDCRELIIGDLRNGQIVQTGMGFADMPDLVAVSTKDGASLVLSWVNVAGANCARATYRWTGEQLAGESDVVEFPYEDAGCDRALGGD